MFKTKNKLISEDNLLIKIDEINIAMIAYVNSTKFLEVRINSTLSWKDHLTILCKKVNKSTGILNKIKANVINNILLTLHSTLIITYFNYYNVVCAACKSIYLDRLFIKQKKTIYIMCNAKWNSRTEPLFLKLNLLMVYNISKLHICCFMYKYH